MTKNHLKHLIYDDCKVVSLKKHKSPKGYDHVETLDTRLKKDCEVLQKLIDKYGVEAILGK